MADNNNTSFDIDSFIKQIVVIQRSQTKVLCPKGHMFCGRADCWVANDKKGAKNAKLV